VKCYVGSIASNDAETWTLHKVDQKSFEMWCSKRMEKISLTNHVRNEEVLQGVKRERNILYTVKKKKANCTSKTHY
jgi:hypothetical protein